MSPRPVLLALVVLGAARCQAAPSLSFNGVKLGQGWDEFLKEHPKASPFYGERAGGTEKDRRDAIARGRKSKTGFLVDFFPGKVFDFALFFFENQKLMRIQTDSYFSNKGIDASFLYRPINEVLAQLGVPTACGVARDIYLDEKHHLLLVWERGSQCALVEISWPPEQPSHGEVYLRLVNRPWKTLHSIPWRPMERPALIQPNQDDETKRLWLFALLERIKPNSTNNIRLMTSEASR